MTDVIISALQTGKTVLVENSNADTVIPNN